jgi:hypothetical protein
MANYFKPDTNFNIVESTIPEENYGYIEMSPLGGPLKK